MPGQVRFQHEVNLVVKDAAKLTTRNQETALLTVRALATLLGSDKLTLLPNDVRKKFQEILQAVPKGEGGDMETWARPPQTLASTIGLSPNAQYGLRSATPADLSIFLKD